jgi:hypothetical protein
MAIKLPTSSIARPSKFYPNWDFWFEHKPSGNPAEDLRKGTRPGADVMIAFFGGKNGVFFFLHVKDP